MSRLDLDSFLVALYTLVDDWWQASHPPSGPERGRPVLLFESEVLTLAILSQWPRWRSERDFCRFADAHLRPYFPTLLSQSQLNRRIRALEPELRTLQRHLVSTLADGSEVYRVLDTTLIPAVVRVRACRKGLFAGQAAFERNVSKTEWVYGFKVALSVTPEGVVTAFRLAPANCDERPIGEFLVARDGHHGYLADKASPRSNGRNACSKSMVRWSRRHRSEARGEPGTKGTAVGRPASARSSKAS
ncbi:MAG: hypothetical protein M3R38_06790 [Actinomycetota bacterium]|nr:hypothetical protein [Actinomycetota bacterium]